MPFYDIFYMVSENSISSWVGPFHLPHFPSSLPFPLHSSFFSFFLFSSGLVWLYLTWSIERRHMEMLTFRTSCLAYQDSTIRDCTYRPKACLACPEGTYGEALQAFTALHYKGGRLGHSLLTQERFVSMKFIQRGAQHAPL